MGNQPQAGTETVSQVKDAGGEARLFQVDLADAGQIAAAVEQTLAVYGTPYLLINNASIYPRASVIDMKVEDWERTLRVNITAPFLIVRGFGPHMLKKKRGVVINIASGRGVEGAPRGANYACSKAAILSLTKTLALEWASQNVRVNAIIPGRVDDRPAFGEYHAARAGRARKKRDPARARRLSRGHGRARCFPGKLRRRLHDRPGRGYEWRTRSRTLR